MAEMPSIFAQAIYKNVINWKVEDVIYITILSKIRKHFKDVWGITYDYIFNFLTYLGYYMTPRFWEFETSSKKCISLAAFFQI